MLWSKLFIPTLRDAGQQLLLRAGYTRPVAADRYIYLFLGQRSLQKITRIVREEMDAMGAQEMLLPAGNIEELMTATARGELRSYKQLPQIWYQVQTKLESCSFDVDAAGLEVSYQKHYDAYLRIFDRCGLEYMIAGGDFMVESEAGEDFIVRCRECGYAANRERASTRASAPRVADPEGDLAPEAFHTPGRKTIAEVSEFTGLPETSQMKSLVLMAGDAPVLVLLRGDHQLSETKFGAVTEQAAFRPANAEEIRRVFGADPGSLGPVGATGLRILADHALAGRRNMIAGANRDDYHLRHVTPGEDFQAEFMDLRQVEASDGCAGCGAALEMRKTLEIGHIRKLGYMYAESMGMHVTNSEGEEVTPIMGAYGVNIEHVLYAAAELSPDKDGMCLPVAIAPFTVVVTPVNLGDREQREASEAIYRACLDAGLDALMDDRDERPGVKFKDADLIGVPFRITVGRKAAGGVVELVERRGRKVTEVEVSGAAQRVMERLEGQDGG